MEEAILVVTDEVEELHYILDTRQERPHHEFAPDGDYKTKETQWTSTAPTEQSTMIGSDTSSESISTITAASNRWKEDKNAAVVKNRYQMIELQRAHSTAMLAPRQSMDERFQQGNEQTHSMSQCYRALLQTNGEAVTRMNHSLRWSINENRVIRSKLDFIIGNIRVDYTDGQSRAPADAAARTADKQGWSEGHAPSPRPKDGRAPELLERDFHRDLEALDDRIIEYAPHETHQRTTLCTAKSCLTIKEDNSHNKNTKSASRAASPPPPCLPPLSPIDCEPTDNCKLDRRPRGGP